MALALCFLFICSTSVSAFYSSPDQQNVAPPTVPASAVAPAQSNKCSLFQRLPRTMELQATPLEPSVSSISCTPSRINLDDATISYPETLMGKLFSSVPKRTYAVDHISTSFGIAGDGIQSNTPAILVGRSASGKSSLLRLISGEDVPTSGTVAIEGLAKPIIIDRKPPLNSKSVLDGIVASAMQRKEGEAGQKDTSKHYGILKQMTMDFGTNLGLTSQQLQSKPSSLSPSGLFLFAMARGCLNSMMPAVDDIDFQGIDADSSTYIFQGPILLLDELFDFEHPDVPAKCCPGIDSLVKNMGAVIIFATHKPHHWEMLESRRVVALSSGRILAEEMLGKGKSNTMVYK